MDNQALNRLGLEAQIHFWQSMAVAQLKEKDIVAVATRLKDSYLNLVVHTQLDEASIEKAISAVTQFFAQHHVDWTWCVGPLSTPNLSKHLVKHNFLFIDRFPSLYISLENYANYEIPNKFSIHEINNERYFTDWIKPIRESFPSLDEGEGFKKLNAQLPYGENKPFRHFIGYYQNQAISSITLFIHNKTVMIHNLATAPAFRNQGFATLLVQYVLKICTEMGMQYCFLDTSDMGLSMYQKLGFEIYCHHTVYQLKNNSKAL